MSSTVVNIVLVSGNAVGSPMQPRPSSQQLEGQNAHMNQSPMATQGTYTKKDNSRLHITLCYTIYF